eukprot:TRINITY_DN1338_c1_g1_i2.p1 TRINITY_DN1338_c1_g1~~TRINITY_DN1338_c1_g1_i2.p1  ORF type:complete len:657 (+),score=203.23 TRINITY_DN1338_c1_g1_i2:317-2287(+)
MDEGDPSLPPLVDSEDDEEEENRTVSEMEDDLSAPPPLLDTSDEEDEPDTFDDDPPPLLEDSSDDDFLDPHEGEEGEDSSSLPPEFQEDIQQMLDHLFGGRGRGMTGIEEILGLGRGGGGGGGGRGRGRGRGNGHHAHHHHHHHAPPHQHHVPPAHPHTAAMTHATPTPTDLPPLIESDEDEDMEDRYEGDVDDYVPSDEEDYFSDEDYYSEDEEDDEDEDPHRQCEHHVHDVFGESLHEEEQDYREEDLDEWIERRYRLEEGEERERYQKLTIQQLLSECKQLKEEANQLFKDQMYREAKEIYVKVQSILCTRRFSVINSEEEPEPPPLESESSGSPPTFPMDFQILSITCSLNSAACSIKLNEDEDAVTESDEAIYLSSWARTDSDEVGADTTPLDPLHVKGLYRKAQAYHNLGRLSDAKKVLEKASKLAPDNKDVTAELKRLDRSIREISRLDSFSRTFGATSSLPDITKEKERTEKKSENLKEILYGKDFGGSFFRSNKNRNTFRSTFSRELSGFGFNGSEKLYESCKYVPCGLPTEIVKYGSRIYCSQHSQDGNLFVTASQDWTVRIYDVEKDKFSLKKSVKALHGQWTLTDAAISDDNSLLIYSSVTPVVHLHKVNPTRGNATHRLRFTFEMFVCLILFRSKTRLPDRSF